MGLSTTTNNKTGASIISAYTIYPIDNPVTTYCSCMRSTTCTRKSVIQNLRYEDIFTIPGVVVACFPIEAMLQSTLSCFFQQTCINNLVSVLNQSSSHNIEYKFTTLDNSLPSRYSSGSKLQDIANHLMIEDINWDVSHEYYYENCRPSICSYLTKLRNDLAYATRTMLGLIGGLASVLQIIIPHAVKITRNLMNRLLHRGQHQTQTHPL